MHVLIIPSEEFVPSTNHTSGIFQYHQAIVLQQAGHTVGALSIRQEYSVPMILRAAMWRALRRPVGNRLDGKSLPAMTRLLYDKLLHPAKFARNESVGTVPTMRIDGFYYSKPSPRTNHVGWVRGGMAAFREYVSAHGKPDVVHAHNLDSAGLLAQRIEREEGVPYVVTEHSTHFHRGLVPRGLFPRLTSAARGASAFDVVSPGLSALLQRELGLSSAEIGLMPNVIDPALATLPVSPGMFGGGFQFLCVGNLIPVKNHGLLVRAFTDAFADSPTVTLRIGGDGELRKEIEALIAELGMSDRIQLVGRLERRELVQALDECDAFVLPSHYETFGVVLIESLSRGRPVITTASGGPESFVTDADGEVVPNDDRVALAAAMERMVVNAKNYDPHSLNERALAKFGPQAVLARLELVYERAVS